MDVRRDGGAASTTAILVIDDREENRMVLRSLFEPPQWRVLEAADGRTGLELAQRERPDCILLDLSMPGLNGFEGLERLPAGDVPVIILTATDDSAAAMDRALRGGAVDYIMKPLSPSRVAVCVRAVVERGRPRFAFRVPSSGPRPAGCGVTTPADQPRGS